jgi:type II secretory ATPase GspE/PulE/Tfp pilus assembly ATPase PilB-like protein
LSTTLSAGDVQQRLSALDPAEPAYATRFVDALLDAARRLGASDVHVQPGGGGLEVRWRLDGVLQPVGTFPAGEAADVVTRLKVLADLLTYKSDVPQEGRIRKGADRNGRQVLPGGEIEMRVSTFPTLHGERAVVRIFAAAGGLRYLPDLGLPAEIETGMARLIGETSGALIVAGPAGSGKTTTVYAALRELVRAAGGGKSIVSLEDPIEMAIEGVAQSQVSRAAGFDLATGLRSIMRQDPEVIAVGEIRDGETAETAFQASLTGHLVLTTFHAGSAATALSRLADMGIEPYVLRSGLLAVVCQRLVRRLCQCAEHAGSGQTNSEQELLGLPVSSARAPRGCEQCLHTGYRGRMVLAEMLLPETGQLAPAILSRADATELQRRAVAGGMTTVWQRALAAVEAGQTSPAEVRRVLGFAGKEWGNPKAGNPKSETNPNSKSEKNKP